MNFEFSIIIPIYKCKFFERAINSVRNQKYKKWELIIIDNNSDDSVKQFLRQIQDNRIKYYNKWVQNIASQVVMSTSSSRQNCSLLERE